MKAFALQRPDAPAALVELPTPEPGPGQVRIRVEAASINAFDAIHAAGMMTAAMPHDLPTVVGRDFAGVVDAVGEGWNGPAVGTAVFGFVPTIPPLKVGTFAEAFVGGEELVQIERPAELPARYAAALPLAGSAALDLLDAVDASAGDTILLVGATGGVGALTTELAALRGAHVIATARPSEADFCRDLGAAETIDWTAGSLADAVLDRYPDGVTSLIDLVNREGLGEIARAVRRGGRVASIVGGATPEALVGLDVTGTNVRADPTPEKLAELARLVVAGNLRVPIQATYPLTAAADALTAFREGKLGKIVIVVG